jgi:penicillin-binding protein A
MLMATLAAAAGLALESQAQPPIATNVAGAATPAPAPAPSAPAPAQAAPAPQEARAETPAAPDEIPTLLGDAPFRGQLDLAKARLDGDRYVVPLADGRTAVLTLDPAIQKAAEAAIARAKAPRAAIVVTATDGTILALAGLRGGDKESERDLGAALEVWAPAASIFKIVTAAALVDGGVEPATRVCYHGGFRSVEASNLRNDARRDKACDDLTFGLARSQNAIIAKLAHSHLEPASLAEVAARFGFDRAPSFALRCDPNRSEIPADSLEFARVSAGFWHTELSPLGGALVANTIASGGLSVTPRIVDHVLDGERVSARVSCEPAKRVLSENVARQVAAMMVETTETGTAKKGFHDLRGRKFLPGIAVAGKTGTLTRTDPEYLQYSWFVGFAPADAPKVSVSVLLGNPPKWHLKAHTAARLVLQEIF